MEPVNFSMANLNIEASAKYSPNAFAAAQDTGQSQEIVREGIRIVQTVQASEAASQSQRVHRKNENDEREGRQGGQNTRDSFEHSHTDDKLNAVLDDDAPVMRENVRTKKSFNFIA